MLGQFVDNFDTRQIRRQRLALATAFGRRNDFLVANRIVGLDSAFSWGAWRPRRWRPMSVGRSCSRV